MKKSKILGLSLGFTALAAVAVATPLVITSCGVQKGVINPETGLAEVNVKNTAVQFASTFIMDNNQEIGFQIGNLCKFLFWSS